MERFAIPGVGGIIEKTIDGIDHILIQDRVKDGAQEERGLIEIPAGKIREFENIFNCLKREIMEETGLKVVEILGEKDAEIFESHDYQVISYQPFICSQNLTGRYPIMVQIFICKVIGEIVPSSNESVNVRWVSIQKLRDMLTDSQNHFYPMHVVTLQKYLIWKGE